MLSAFPNEDPIEHRKYHDILIEAATEQKKFWTDIRLHFAKLGIVSLVVFLLGLLGLGAIVKLKSWLGL
jgi:hypothetical protein